MDQLVTPHLVVINSTSQQHYIPDDEPLKMTPHSIHLFLDAINNSSLIPLGGNTYFVQMNRALFELRKALVEMWRGNPVLTTVIFGLPLGFLFLILYSVCCGDCLVTEEFDDNNGHEKKE